MRNSRLPGSLCRFSSVIVVCCLLHSSFTSSAISSSTSSSSSASSLPSPGNCDFENSTCGWINSRPTTVGSFWSLYNEHDSSWLPFSQNLRDGYLSFGHVAAHSFYCHDFYCETGLKSTASINLTTSSCLDFWYYVETNETVTLRLYTIDSDGRRSQVWRMKWVEPEQAWRNGLASLNSTTSEYYEFVVSFNRRSDPKQPVQVVAIDSLRFYDGRCVKLTEEDILVSEGGDNDPIELMQFHAAVIKEDNVWPNARIPYTIASAFTTDQRQIILDSMNEINSKTCVKFIPRTDEVNYLNVFQGSWCYSFAGKISKPEKQPVSFHASCLNFGTVLHELMHAVGFYHEHSRYDRDNYITIVWESVAPGSTNQFQKYTLTEVDHLGLPYDYDSVMHYSKTAYARSPGQITIRPKDGNARIGQRKELSVMDIQKVNKKYGCLSSSDVPGGATSGGDKFTAGHRVSNPIDCDFNLDLCQWKTLGNNINFGMKWGLFDPSMRHYEARPYGFQSNRGKYAAIESMSKNGRGTLVSEQVYNSGCLTFYYMISGYGLKTLSVYVITDSTEVIWEMSRENSLSESWDRAQIPISADRFRLQIVADVARQNTHGDVGIDDFSFKPSHGECSFIPLKARPTNRRTDSSFNTLNCTFERSNFCGWFNTESDEFNWKLNRGRTETPFSGPAHDHTQGSSDAGFYVYASGRRPRGERARMLSPEIVGYSNVCFHFWYQMYGNGMGSLRVFKSNVERGVESRLWEMKHDQGTLWHEAFVSIPANPISKFRLVLEADIGDNEQSDISVDDLEVYLGMNCYSLFQPSRPVTPAVANYYAAPPRTPEPIYRPFQQKESTTTASRRVVSAQSNTILRTIRCNFDDVSKQLCFWSQQTRDDFDWTVQTGPSPSKETGPDYDHSTGRGYYIYIESSTPRYEWNSAVLRSAPLGNTIGCLKFHYHMLGRGIGHLRVLTLISNEYKTVWQLSGEQSSQWQEASIPLFMPNGGQVYIEGVVGNTYQGDIAVDDLDFIPGEYCQMNPERASTERTAAKRAIQAAPANSAAQQIDTPTNCTLDNEFTCLWAFSKDGSDQFVYSRVRPLNLNARNSRKPYIYILSDSHHLWSTVSITSSPLLRSVPRCLKVTYFMTNGADQLSLALRDVSSGVESPLAQLSAGVLSLNESIWRESSYSIMPQRGGGRYRIVVNMKHGTSTWKGIIALQSIIVTNGLCQ